METNRVLFSISLSLSEVKSSACSQPTYSEFYYYFNYKTSVRVISVLNIAERCKWQGGVWAVEYTCFYVCMQIDLCASNF